MHGFEMEGFAMQFGRFTIAFEFPCKHGGVVFVVAQRFSFRSLVFLAKVRAA
jgi:hypothetical protein